MTAIKIAEIFGGNKPGGTIQGEGLHAGVPSVFVRTFGCNFRCPGFGMPRGEKSTEALKVIPSNYSNYSDLPLVTTGCDTYAAIYPQFKHLSPMMEIPAIVDKIQSLLENGRFNKDVHLILTGGEPLLGWQKSYPDLLEEIIHRRKLGLTDLTFETNGTQPISEELRMTLFILSGAGTSPRGLTTTFSVSAKLPCSGQTWEEAIKPDVVVSYQAVPRSTVYLKFVVATEEDVQDAHRAVKEYRDAGFTGSVYLMPVGGVNSVYELNEKKVAELAIANGYRFSPRLQIPLFKNAWGT